jgi:hypothetical protein
LADNTQAEIEAGEEQLAEYSEDTLETAVIAYSEAYDEAIASGATEEEALAQAQEVAEEVL